MIHAHAVLMHLTEPVRALRAMYRVVKPGGIVASRDPSGRGIVAIHPDRPPFNALMAEHSPAQMRYVDAMGSRIKAGVYKEGWAREAGFGGDGGRIEVARSLEHVTWEWNILKGSFADRAVEMGIATREQVERWAWIWKEWVKEEGRFQKREFVDMLCFKGEET